MTKKNEKKRHATGDDHPRAFGAQVILSLAGVALLAAIAAVAYAPLKNHVADLRASEVVAEFDWPGGNETWLPPVEQARLLEIVAGMVGPDPFDGDSLQNAADALMETGWFESIDALRRRRGGVVRVEGEWRLPAAVVRTGGREALVSRRGALLPMEYPVGGGWPMRFIQGVWSGPPRRNEGSYAFGDLWTGGDVQASISLLAFLRKSEAWSSVAGVDCSGFMEHGRLTIVTVHGGEVVWGAPPGAGAPGEEDDSLKNSRFERLMTDPGWISAGRPRIEIYPSVVLIDESDQSQ